METTELSLFFLTGMNNRKIFKNLKKIHAALGKKKSYFVKRVSFPEYKMLSLTCDLKKCI